MPEPDPNNPDHDSPHSSGGGEPVRPGDLKSPLPEAANADSSHASREDDTAAGPEVDLTETLRSWPIGGNRPTVRMIRTATGERAVQVRLELGILQLALTGRPDGRRPHGADSLLDWHIARLEAYRRRAGSDQDMHLTSKDCDALRDEGVQVYHRYVALFALEEYEAVVRDTGAKPSHV